MINIHEYADDARNVIESEISRRISLGENVLDVIYDVSVREDVIVRQLNCITGVLNCYAERLAGKHKTEKEIQALLEFKNSNIGHKIKDFIECNKVVQQNEKLGISTPYDLYKLKNSLFDEIKSEIAKDNPFDIRIHDKDFSSYLGERFSVCSIEKYYRFDNFDIDEDIQLLEEYLDENNWDYYNENLPYIIEEDDEDLPYIIEDSEYTTERANIVYLIKLCFEKYGEDFCQRLRNEGKYFRRYL